MQNRIPGGLIDKSTEFFSVLVGAEMEPYCNHSGHTYCYSCIPATILATVEKDMRSRPVVELAIEEMVGVNQADKIRKYITCRYGALNSEADIDSDGRLSEPEYVPCALRGTCKFEGRICCSIAFSPSVTLSKAETHVFKLVRLPDKLIADQLFLSVETVKKHFQNIRFKTGLNNKIEMAIWATQKGII